MNRRLAWFYLVAVLDIIAWAVFVAFLLAVLGTIISVAVTAAVAIGTGA